MLINIDENLWRKIEYDGMWIKKKLKSYGLLLLGESFEDMQSYLRRLCGGEVDHLKDFKLF